MLTELVDAPNPWAVTNHGLPDQIGCGRSHCCYFCGPACYPPMPASHTLCVRCGHLIRTSITDDPHNLGMLLCPGCEDDLAEEVARD